MKTTQKVRLGDICTIRTGKLDSNAAVEGGKYPFFTCAQETFNIDKFAFDTEAVLLGGNNANGIFPLKYYRGKFNAYQRTYLIETKDNKKVLNKYIYFSLRPVLDYFKSASIGATTQYLTKPVLVNLKIDLPDVNSQKRIVDIVFLYDDLIDTNRRRIQLLEESARLLYREWFVYFRFPLRLCSGQVGHEKVKLVDGAPDGWQKTTLGKIATRIKKSYSINEEDLPLVDLARIQNRTLAITEVGASSDLETARIIFEKDDVLFSSIRPYLHKVVFSPFKGITNNSVLVIRAKRPNYRGYLALLLFSDYAIQFANQHSTGTKMPVVKWNSVSMIPAWIPPDNIMDEFESMVSPMLQQIQLSYFHNQKLAQARDLLLPRLMSGKIEV
jgi:type I restriction enzyme S subunit